jgi:hypothetical protein
MEQNSSFESFELQVSSDAKEFLATTASWAFFLSIVGFIIVGLSLLGSVSLLFAGAAMPEGNPATAMLKGGMLGAGSLLFSILWGIPVVYLFKFASSAKEAINENNTQRLTEALKNLRSHYKMAGILTILSIIAYIIFIVFVAASVATSMKT